MDIKAGRDTLLNRAYPGNSHSHQQTEESVDSGSIINGADATLPLKRKGRNLLERADYTHETGTSS